MSAVTSTPPAGAKAVLPPLLPARKRNRSLAKFMKNRAAVVGGIIVLVFALAAIFAPLLAHQDPFQTSFLTIRQPPSGEFWFGTDELGRDIYSRMLYGARASLMAGVVSVGIAVAIGVPLGLIAGYFGSYPDMVISRFTDALLAIPFLILAIALAAFLGPSLTNAMIAIGLSAVPIFIRITRGQALSVKAEDYVEGARAIGLPHWRIITRYIFPNTLPPSVRDSITPASSRPMRLPICPASRLPPALSAAEAASMSLAWRPLRLDSGRPSASRASASDSSLAGSVHTCARGAEARPPTSMPAVTSPTRRSARMSSSGSDTGVFDHDSRPRVIASSWP